MKCHRDSSAPKRIAYIKNGDVIEEIKLLSATVDDEVLRMGGPMHYIASFMKWSENSHVLCITMDKSDKKHAEGRRLAAMVMNTKQHRTRLLQVWLHLKAFSKILLNLLKFRPDWILCAISGGPPLAACYLASLILQVPFVHSRHMRVELYKPNRLQILKSRMDAWMIRRAVCLLCNGPYLLDQLLKIGVDREKVIQFGPPYQDLGSAGRPDDAIARFKDFYRNCTLLYVGRIEENKGALDLLEASRGILTQSNQNSLIYIGEGTALEKVRKMAAAYGVDHKVFFTGQLPHASTIRMMQRADIMVVPTRRELGEGNCKAAIEGLILGLALVVPDYGAFKYIIRDRINGLFYYPDDIQDLDSKIACLVENTDIRKKIAHNARKMGVQLLQPERTFIQALQEAYHFSRKARGRSI